MGKIIVKTSVKTPVKKVWEFYTSPEHIKKWNQASPDWHTTKSENDLRVGGKFLSCMEARDGSAGFDFSGVYTEVVPNRLISYKMDDDRDVEVKFNQENEGETRVEVTFDPEDSNSLEMQRQGWQAILDSFKKYTEENI